MTSLFPSGTPEDSQRLKQAVRLGSQVPASNAGRTLALNRKMGMPLAVIQRNLPAVEAQAAQQELNADEFRSVYPVAAQWMAEHPLHAAVGVPDLKQMSAIEAAATALKMGFTSGRRQAEASTAMFDAMDSGRQLHPMERYLLEKGMRDASREPSRRNFLEDVLFYGSQFAGQMSTAVPDVAEGAGKGFMGAAIAAIGATLAGVSAPVTIGGGIAVGGVYGLAKSVFKQEAGAAYDGLSQIEGSAGETIDESTKRTAAYGVGALNAAIEVALDVTVLGAPFKQLAKKFAQDATNDLLVRPTMRQAMAQFGKHYVGALIAEPTQEVAQEMTNIVAEEVSKMVTNGNFATLMNDPQQREEAMQRLADIAEQTAKGSLLIGLPGPSLNMASDIVRARNATKRVNAYIALGKAMESASPALLESGGAATVAERSVGSGANFYIDVQPFTEYWQSAGVDPRVAAKEIWGDAKVYDEALQGNSAMEIPVRTYAEKVAATPANEFFAKEIRRSPDEMNGKESEAFLKAAQETLSERAKESETEKIQDTERDLLVDKIATQLKATQQYREQDARDMAQQMAHFYTAMASQLENVTAAQLAERYPLTITKGDRPVEMEVKARRDRAKAAGAAAEAQAKVLGDVTTQLEAQAVSPDPDVAETAKGRLAFLNTITPSFSDEEEAARLTAEEGEARAANRARPRTPSGRLKNLAKASIEELANEYQILTDANAVENVAPTSIETDYGEKWTGMKGGAMKAMGRIAARNKTIAKLEAELTKRGVDLGEAYMKGYSDLVNSQPEGFSFEQGPHAGPNLMVLHNLSADNLRYADELGGFAVPSLGVTKEGHSYGGMGAITLIGKPHLGDPTVVPVHDADVYSPTFPRPEYPKAKDKDAQKLFREVKPWAEKFDEPSLPHEVWDNAVNRVDPQKTIGQWVRSNAMRAMFLSQQGIVVEPVLRKAEVNAPFVKTKAWRAFQKETGFQQNFQYDDTEYRKKLAQAVNDGIDEWVARRKDPAIRELLASSARNTWLGEDGLVPFGYTMRIERSLAAIGRMDVDRSATDDVVNEAMKGKEEEFREWSEAKVLAMHGEPFLKLGRKRVPFTLENVVAVMTGPIKNQQDTMTFGEGKARAESATRFDSLQWMRNASHQIEGEQAISEAREKAKALLSAYRDSVVEYYTEHDWRGNVDTWAALDASMRAIARWARGRSMAEALRAEGFAGVPKRIIEQAIEAGNAFKNAPVPYFEAKPQRAVALDEFAGAVIPKSSPDFVREILTKHGIEMREYDASGQTAEAERTAQIKGLTDELGPKVLFQDSGQGPRGRITFAGREFNIEILPKADLSTFLHESGHFYLEVLGDLAKDSPRVAADYEKILKYLGAEAGVPLTVDQHETFARSIEAYFLEGKAPSLELRRVFHRFRTWLMALYRTIVGLDVKLTNEVRGVFDRMFATDQEIARAEREAELVPIFTTAGEAGMSADEFANYQQTVEDAHVAATDKVRTKVLRQFMRERDEWWKEARADVRQQVADEINARPVYVALDVLRKGLYPDGTVVENQPRLNKAEIVALKGADFLKRLGSRIYQAEDGMSLEQASEQFGFTSGDEMLQAFVDAPSRKQVIESETDLRMKAKYGDMVSDGTLAEEAEAAVQNEHQADVVHAEMRALRRLANKVKPFVRQAELEGEAAVDAEQRERDYERRWLEAEHKLATAIAVGKKQAEIDGLRKEARAAKAETAAGRRAFNAGIPDIAFVRQVARERIAQVKVRDIRPMVYWVAARKAARAAIAAAGKQDFVAALNEKQHELLNQELYRAAQQALEQAEADKDYANNLQTTAKQQRLGKAGGGYLEQINSILERFDFRIRTNVAADRRASLLRFIEDQKAQDIPIDIPVDIQDEAYRKPWREMTVEELRGVTDTLRHLDHLATFKNKLLKDAAKRTLEEAQGQAAASIAEHAKRTLPAKAESNLPQDKASQRIQAFVAAHRKLASYLRQMDGFVDGGVLQQMIMRQLNEADQALSAFNADATKRLSDIFAKHYTKSELVGLYKKTYQKSLKDSLSKMGVLMMALNWGTEDNQHKLVAGLGLTYKRQISETDVGAVLNQLDKRDWAFVQDVWELIGSYWPQIESLAKRLDGIAPQKIDGVPIQTKFGIVNGAYFPISYDKTQSTIRHHDAIAVTADEVRQGATAKRSTKAGARNERVSGVKSPLRLDFGVIREHLNDLAQDLTHTETLIDVGRILTGDEVKSAIRDHYGDVVYKQIMSSIDAIAAGDVPAQDGWDAAANFIRSGATVAGLGWNLTTSFLQPLGLSNSISRVGAKWVALGLKEWLGDAVHMQNTTKWIVEKSTMMKYRTTTQMRETAELMHSIGMDRSFTESLIDLGMDKVTAGTVDLADLKQSYFWFITRMQLAADIPTWLGAYRKALASMPASEVDDAKAVSIADQAVLDAQSGGAIKDLASVQRGGAFRKIFTAFYSYMNLVLNQNAEAFARLDLKKPASVGRFISDMAFINLIPVTVGYFVKRAVRGHDGDDDPEKIAEDLLREYGSYATGMFVGLRELSGVIQGYAGYEGPAGARFYAEVAKLMQQAGQGEADAAFLKALNGAAGVIFHYPAGQVQRTVQGFNALAEGRTSNPMALLFGPPTKR